MTNIEKFCQIARSRSGENRQAMALVGCQNLFGPAMSTLRQELDSMVRSIYLLNIPDISEREYLIAQMLSGQKWKRRDSKTPLTDKEMVEIANNLNGWTKSVYKFGCAFIHLSAFHNYRENDPFSGLSSEETQDIKSHLNHYHGFPMDLELRVSSVERYMSMIFEKISNNLERYLSDLENGRGISW